MLFFQQQGEQKKSFSSPLTTINGFPIKFKVAHGRERPNWSTNNGDMAEIAKRPVSDGVKE